VAVRVQVMKIRVYDFDVCSEHRSLADKNTCAIADNRDIVVHPNAIPYFDNRFGSTSFYVNVSTKEVRGGVAPEPSRTIEANSSLSGELNRLENCRAALNVRAIRQKAKFGYSITLVNA